MAGAQFVYWRWTGWPTSVCLVLPKWVLVSNNGIPLQSLYVSASGSFGRGGKKINVLFFPVLLLTLLVVILKKNAKDLLFFNFPRLHKH